MSTDFNKIFLKICDTLVDNFSNVSSRLRIEDVGTDISSIVTIMYKRDILNDSFAEVNANEFWCSPQYFVLKFIVLSYLSSYYGFSNIDFSLKVKIVNENGDTEPVKNRFGYKGSCQILREIFDSYLGADTTLEKSTFDKLLSVERDCSAKEYFAKEYYKEDVRLINTLMTGTFIQAHMNEDEKKVLIQEFGGTLLDLVSKTVNVYKELLAGAFGLERYCGVFTFNKIYGVQGLNRDGTIKTIEPNRELKNPFGKILRETHPCHLPLEGTVDGQRYSDRQFDLRLIESAFRKDPNVPVYFPHKVLEIISIMEYTTKQNTQVYKPSKKGNNLAEYLDYLGYTSSKPNELDAVVKTPFYTEYLNALGYICEHKLKELNQKNNTNFTLIDIFENEECPYYKNNSPEIIDYCKRFLEYCFKCYTTCFILTSLTTGQGYASNQILDFRIKVSYPGESIKNKEFMARVKELYSAIQVNLSGVSDSEANVQKSGMYIQDYAYTANPDLVFGRPIFAYKALDEMIKQGRPINWNNILLGKSKDGSLVTSSKHDSINLQTKRFHYIIAGSRSGKGVMCYNIFATALASGKPIFYMDRKPDTASIMKQIAPNMFAVNGGDYKEEFDLTKSLGFNPNICKIPSYISEVLNINTLDGIKAIGDFAYYRAVLLCISLLVFMDNNKASKDQSYMALKSKLKDGMCVVIDEFTNFTNEFLLRYINSDGGVFSELKKMEKLDVILNNEFSGLSKAIINREKLQEKDKVSNNELEMADKKIENVVSSMQRSQNFSLKQLYWGAYFDKQIQIFKDVKALKNAAIQYLNNAHFFIIGQDIIPELFDSNLEPNTAAGSSEARFTSSTFETSVGKVSMNSFYSFLNTQDSDVILGYQPPDKGVPTYLAQASGNGNNPACDLLTAEKRFFCYKAIGNGQLGSEFAKIRNTEAKVGAGSASYANGFKYFKPFLILNNGVTPPVNLRYSDPNNSRDTSVTEQLEAQRKIGNYQYVGQCITTCNRIGLTYDDLYEDNKGENGELCKDIGFEEYMSKLLASNPNCNNSVADLLNSSGDIMSIFVNNILGYDGTVMEFLYDFRPEWLFCPDDFTAKLKNKNSGVIERLKNSFFRDSIVNAKAGDFTFTSIYGDQLGSLSAYYNGEVTQSTIDRSYNLVVSADEEESYSEEQVRALILKAIDKYDKKYPTRQLKARATNVLINQAVRLAMNYLED